MADPEKAAAAAAAPSAQQIEKLPDGHAPASSSVRRYLATRLSTLKPPMHRAPNPFRLLSLLSRRQWAFFAIGFVAWVRMACTSPPEGSVGQRWNPS